MRYKRYRQQRHGQIGIGVNDDSVNIVMDELELELNDDSNKIEAVVLRVETVRSQTKMRD